MRHPHLATLTATTFVTWTGQRITAVALPLVALDQTGDAWTTGLVGGFAGLPLLTSAWWGRRLRARLTSGRSLAILLAVQVLGLVLVPVAAATVGVGAVVLCATGLVTGTTSAMLAPAQRALTADLAELPGNGPDVGARALAWQDLAHRSSMIFAPPLGAWLLVVWGAEPLLWCEAAAVALSAVAMLTVPGAASDTPRWSSLSRPRWVSTSSTSGESSNRRRGRARAVRPCSAAPASGPGGRHLAGGHRRHHLVRLHAGPRPARGRARPPRRAGRGGHGGLRRRDRRGVVRRAAGGPPGAAHAGDQWSRGSCSGWRTSRCRWPRRTCSRSPWCPPSGA